MLRLKYGIIIDDYLYVIPSGRSILYVVDISDAWKLVRVVNLNVEVDRLDKWKIIKYDETSLYFVLLNTMTVVEYDIPSNSVVNVFEGGIREDINEVFERDGYIWFVPYNIVEDIYRISLELDDMEKYRPWIDSVKNISGFRDMRRISSNSKWISFIGTQEDRIHVYDIENNMVKVISDYSNVMDATLSGDMLCVLTRTENGGSFYKYDLNEDEAESEMILKNQKVKKIIPAKPGKCYIDAGEVILLITDDGIIDIKLNIEDFEDGANYITVLEHDKEDIFLPWNQNVFIRVSNSSHNVNESSFLMIDPGDSMIFENVYNKLEMYLNDLNYISCLTDKG